jgi:predicted PurR-regulated permease PerM
LQKINSEGMQAPIIFNEIPWLGAELTKFWNNYIAEPGAVQENIKNLHVTLAPASYFIKQVGVNIAHKSFQVSFTILTLFFFYRDNETLLKQINIVGLYCLGDRWQRYAIRLPRALRSTVNGTVVVGIGVGILMGLCYSLVGFPAPTLTGFITAFASMIPFFVPVVFIIIALILAIKGFILNSIIVLIWGTIVMFVADHFVKPALIGGAIRLPFLAVLFGILGGMETLGLMGLFFGPIIMVLFITLWQEPIKKHNDNSVGHPGT